MAGFRTSAGIPYLAPSYEYGFTTIRITGYQRAFRGKGGNDKHRSRRDPDPHFYACRYGGQRESRQPTTAKRRGEGPDHFGQYLSFVSAAGSGDITTSRRFTPVQRLGSAYSDR